MHPSIATWCNDVEQVRWNVDAAECTSHARICDGGSGVGTRDRVVDGDLLAADWIAIRFCWVVH